MLTNFFSANISDGFLHPRLRALVHAEGKAAPNPWASSGANTVSDASQNPSPEHKTVLGDSERWGLCIPISNSTFSLEREKQKRLREGDKNNNKQLLDFSTFHVKNHH